MSFQHDECPTDVYWYTTVYRLVMTVLRLSSDGDCLSCRGTAPIYYNNVIFVWVTGNKEGDIACFILYRDTCSVFNNNVALFWLRQRDSWDR